MSEKKAKINTVAPKTKQQATHKIQITVMPDGKVEVFGFPNNFNHTMEIMKAGIHRVAAYFVMMAREGEVDQNLNLKKSPIIKPNSKIVTVH